TAAAPTASYPLSLHDALPISGEITEYQVFSSIRTLSPMPIPNAPPEAPSPIITQITGTLSINISFRFRAIASPWPRSSASIPGRSEEHTSELQSRENLVCRLL